MAVEHWDYKLSLELAWSRSCDVFNFSEIGLSDNISETVQDTDWKTNRKSYMGYRMALLPMILSEFEGHLLLSETFEIPITHK